MDENVLIMMTTYNGEKYLSQQLDSIISQTYFNWTLLIGDDGSRDSTLKILKQYQKKDSRIGPIIQNNKNHGTFNNIYNLMEYVKNRVSKKYHYFFYCDQDDIWDQNKIKKEIALIKKAEQEYYNIPILCYSNLKLIDSQGNSMEKNMNELANINLQNPYNLFFKHRYIWGTTMAHNESLWKLIKIPEKDDNKFSHDNLLGKYAVAYGKIFYMNEPLVLYRRHKNNVSDLPTEHKLKKTLQGVKYFIRYYSFICRMTLDFIEEAPYQTCFMEEYKRCISNGGKSAVEFINKYKISVTSDAISTLLFRMIFFTRIYKMTGCFRKQKDIDNEKVD